MKANKFLKTVESASPGDRIIYHTGNLADDRQRARELDAVAAAAWEIGAPKEFRIGGRDATIDASGFGAGSLVQRRHHACVYEYVLVMKRPLTDVERAVVRKILVRREESANAALAA